MKPLSKKEWIAVAAAAVFVSYTLFGADIMRLFKKDTMNENQEPSSMVASNNNVGGVVINDIKVGNGLEAKKGQMVTVNYILALSDGKQIQNSKDFGQPFTFTLGAGQVIQGWEQGFAGMKVGGTRTIIIPPELGYGAQQAGPIPPNSTLVFTIELLDVKDAPTQN
jgi:FKBP-type peptidyl-prolyl cis-trans isomerase FkpA